jgi:uncharacterized membrane protein
MSEPPRPEHSVPVEVQKPEPKPGVTQYQQVNFNFNLGQVLPDPEKLHQYPPEMIKAMVEMARAEQAFRHKVVLKDQDHKMWFDRRAQYCTLVSYILLFGIGGAAVILGHAWFGSTLVGATFVTAIGSSFFNRGEQQTAIAEEPSEEEPPAKS